MQGLLANNGPVLIGYHGCVENNLPPFDTVRAAFPEGTPLYDTAGFLERTHIQICVRHPGSVLGYFRVKTAR